MTMPLDDVSVITVQVPSSSTVLTIQVPGVQGPPGLFKLGTVSTVLYGPNAASATTTTDPSNPNYQIVNLVIPAGPGMAAGGATGDVPVKTGSADYAVGWTTPASAATASTLVKRDASGRAQVADPAVAADISTKNYTDVQVATKAAIAGDLGGTAASPQVVGGTHHGHTSSQITDASSVGGANVVVKTDANGNSQVAQLVISGSSAGIAASNATRKDYVDSGDASTLASAKSYTDTKAGAGVQIAGDLGGTAASPQVTGGTHHTHTSAQVTDAASAATASKVIVRDAAGRAQVADPSVAADIATKNYVDTASNGTSAPTATTTMKRDAAGRAQVADPAVAADIATKNYVDNASNGTSAPTATTTMKRDANGRSQVADPAVAADIATKNYVDLHGNVLFLNATDPVPAGTAANTLIYRPNTVKTANFFWGSVTAFPSSTAKVAGDTCLRTDIGTSGSLWQYTGVAALGSAGWLCEQTIVCTSTTRPTSGLYSGLQILETDTGYGYMYTGTAWRLQSGPTPRVTGGLWRATDYSSNYVNGFTPLSVKLSATFPYSSAGWTEWDVTDSSNSNAVCFGLHHTLPGRYLIRVFVETNHGATTSTNNWNAVYAMGPSGTSPVNGGVRYGAVNQNQIGFGGVGGTWTWDCPNGIYLAFGLQAGGAGSMLGGTAFSVEWLKDLN